MATTYAALVSLVNVLNRFQHPTCPVTLDQTKLQSLVNKVSFLVDFLEAYSETISKDLERTMSDVAFALEDTIESYYVDQIGQRSISSAEEGRALLYQNIEKAIQEMDLIIEEAILVKDEHGEKNQLLKCSVQGGLLAPPSGKYKTVGLDEELIRLMERVTSDQTCRQIIPVVGMGGMGKTTLAKGVYNHPYVVHHFHIRAWVTISQDFTSGSIIRSLLRDLNFDDNKEENFEDDIKIDPSLELKLHKGLSGRKYLIVMDDIWSSRAWDEIRRFLPDNNNGSRVLLTTRLSTVALNVGSCNPYEMMFLDDDRSWELLCHIVFGQNFCYPQLENLGRKIAKSCQGLPLAIVVTGGLLKVSEKTREIWENVAKNVFSIINAENDGHLVQVLSLSYNNLPVYLKPCFLYMATFREDREVHVSDLVKLWVSDGFLRPKTDMTLEKVALEYLNDLIDRNLIMVATRDLSGKTESCKVHDSLREFCLSEAKNEKFLCLVKDIFGLPQRLASERRLVYHSPHYPSYPTMQSMPHARSFVCHSCSPRLSHGWKLLRVYQVSLLHQLRVDICQLVNIRHLALKLSKLEVSRLLSSISLFWNLETLVVDAAERMTLVLPSAIWELPNLRHLEFIHVAAILPAPTADQTNCVLNNLQTLRDIDHFDCTDKVLRKLPNLKELRTYYSRAIDARKLSRSFTNVSRLHKLEKLSIHFDLFQRSDKCVSDELENLTFSPNLRELELSGTKIPWKSMTVFGSLPNLEVLILGQDAFRGAEWSPNEGEFQCLKFLLISRCNLKMWTAENYHFPRLQNLYLKHLKLKEIPSGIGEVPSLELISFETKYISVAISAREILDEQQAQENDDLSIEACCLHCSKAEKMKLENMATDKFKVRFYRMARYLEDDWENKSRVDENLGSELPKELAEDRSQSSSEQDEAG